MHLVTTVMPQATTGPHIGYCICWVPKDRAATVSFPWAVYSEEQEIQSGEGSSSSTHSTWLYYFQLIYTADLYHVPALHTLLRILRRIKYSLCLRESTILWACKEGRNQLSKGLRVVKGFIEEEILELNLGVGGEE